MEIISKIFSWAPLCGIILTGAAPVVLLYLFGRKTLEKILRKFTRVCTVYLSADGPGFDTGRVMEICWARGAKLRSCAVMQAEGAAVLVRAKIQLRRMDSLNLVQADLLAIPGAQDFYME